MSLKGIAGYAFFSPTAQARSTTSGLLEGNVGESNSILHVTNLPHGVFYTGTSINLGSPNEGGGTFENEGTVMPGGPGKIGVTTITGRYIQDPGGVLNINLDVAHPAMSELIVTSNAPMAGTIFITPINLATAKVATSTFTVFHADDGVDPIDRGAAQARVQAVGAPQLFDESSRARTSW